jgi:hypothetical protein
VRIQPGQRRSGQAGSEPCLSPGDWRGRSVGSEEAGREGAAPKTFAVADVDAVSLAEDSIWMTVMRGHWEPPESLARGTLSKGFSRNLGGLPPPPARDRHWHRLTAMGPAPAGMDALARGANDASKRRGTAPSRETGDGRDGLEESYDSIVPGKVGNW